MRLLSALVLLLLAATPPSSAIAAESFGPGLAIHRYRGPGSFLLSEVELPGSDVAERFEALTPAADGDDWTVVDGRGHLATRYGARDVFVARATGGLELEVLWGDIPLAEFMETRLRIEVNDAGCYSTLRSAHVDPEGAFEAPPQAILFCPANSAVLFAVPDGYRILVSARSGDEVVARTEIGPSVSDDVRLYVREIYPRNPSSRETGSALGNVRAGLRDAGADVRDAIGHALLVSSETNMHTGAVERRDAPLIGVARGLAKLATGRPVQGLRTLTDGLETGVQVAADVASAASNSLLTVALQGTVGLVSTRAASSGGDWLGAILQSAIKNLPCGERSRVLLDLRAARHSGRAFAPRSYTRTPTQMNIDRTAAILDLPIDFLILD